MQPNILHLSLLNSRISIRKPLDYHNLLCPNCIKTLKSAFGWFFYPTGWTWLSGCQDISRGGPWRESGILVDQALGCASTS